MIQKPSRLRLWIALAFTLCDLIWAFSALNFRAGANAASTVSAINSAVWIFMHLPAVYLAGLPFSKDSGAAVSMAEVMTIGSLGVLQMAALGYWLGRFFDRKQKP